MFSGIAQYKTSKENVILACMYYFILMFYVLFSVMLLEVTSI